MSTYDKEIESLRNKIERLESAKNLEETQSAALNQIESDLRNALQEADITIDTFLGTIYRDIKRVVARTEKDRAKAQAEKDAMPSTPKKARKKKVKNKIKAKPGIKIPAGNYTNIPSAQDIVFTVKEKGPRLKILKAHAEDIGIEAFLEQCKVA